MDVLVSLLGALAALAGVGLTLWFQERRRRDEQVERRARNRLEKAEEIFREIDRLRNEVAAAIARITEFSQHGNVVEKSLSVNAGVLVGLLNTYFPSAAIVTERYAERNKRAMEVSRAIITCHLETPNAEAVKGATVMMALELNSSLGELLNDASTILHTEAPKLLD
jgi:hypothetical protein